jgi:Flp pilus assembly protein TadB
MMKVVLVALVVAAGAPPIVVSIVAAVVWQPWLVVVGPPAWAVLQRVRGTATVADPDDEAAFLRSLAAELAGGSSLRAALVGSAGRAPRLPLTVAARAAEAGLPAPIVAAALDGALPVNGRLAAAAWRLAAESGAPAAAIVQALALRASEEGALRRERRALVAQARASAWVVAALPAVLLVAMAAGGRLSPDPALLPILAVGLTLQATGVAAVVWMLRRAER